MKTKIEELKKTLLIELSKTTNLEQIKQLRSKFVNKSKLFISLKEQIKKATPNKKKELGILFSFYNDEITLPINEKEKELQYSFNLKYSENELLQNNNLTKIKLKDKNGKQHPLTIAKSIVDKILTKHQFNSTRSIEIENEDYNFNFLNIDKHHLSRNESDTFYLSNKKLLRTHATNMTARGLEANIDSNYKSYNIGYVFRNDDDDSRHSFQFNQIDIYATGSKTSIASLKYFVNEILKGIFGSKTKIFYRLSYFPFTEPSFEVDITCPSCNGKGCSTCSKTGFLEILGCGMINPIVFEKTKRIDLNIKGFAAGIGLERIAMIKWKINDIRNFYTNDLKFLREIK